MKPLKIEIEVMPSAAVIAINDKKVHITEEEPGVMSMKGGNEESFAGILAHGLFLEVVDIMNVATFCDNAIDDPWEEIDDGGILDYVYDRLS